MLSEHGLVCGSCVLAGLPLTRLWTLSNSEPVLPFFSGKNLQLTSEISYYEHLAPLTPIIPTDFRAPAKHMMLLTEEPILAIALLAITSRHMKLSGPGAQSRAYSIHDKLWTYLRCMVERLLWGQEQFGGGFCGGGTVKVRESKTGQITWTGSLRTLGTVEAILLLTDWHPRALHFPPGDDENRLLDADYKRSRIASAVGPANAIRPPLHSAIARSAGLASSSSRMATSSPPLSTSRP